MKDKIMELLNKLEECEDYSKASKITSQIELIRKNCIHELEESGTSILVCKHCLKEYDKISKSKLL